MNRKPHPRLAIFTSAMFLVTMALSATASAEWKEKVLYSFQGGTDGQVPAGGLVFDTQGNLYGATLQGGSASCEGYAECGTVFQLVAPAKKGGAWTENLLYVFRGHQDNDGNAPTSGLITDAAGNLYGVTAYGGSGPCLLLGSPSGCGAVYEMTPPAKQGDPWTETVLYSFRGGTDGHFPNGNLVFDGQGNLYGATMFGGGYGACNGIYGFCGTVFKLSPPKKKGGKWTEKVLHSFAGATDGANPNGDLVLDNNGNIYGTAYAGGGKCDGAGCGTAFELKAPTRGGGAWTEKVLHRFSGQDGSNPAAGMIFDGNGSLYGTTFDGGANHSPWGTVFQLVPYSPGKWTEHLLHTFQDSGDGGEPQSALVFDSKGNLYGTAEAGGSFGRGTLFRLRLGAGGSWGFAALYEFNPAPDGSYPAGGAVFDKSGTLFTTTQYGGSGQACDNGGCGAVIEVKP